MLRPLAVLAALLLAGCAAPTGGPAPAGGATPSWSFTDTDGVVHSRDEPSGNATVLFFMASWCGTCRSKAPLLAKVHADYAEQGVRFYSLSFDPTDDASSLNKWKAQLANAWPHGVDPGFGIQRSFGVTAQSSVVLLDADGRLVERWGYGAVTEASLRARLDETLGGA